MFERPLKVILKVFLIINQGEIVFVGLGSGYCFEIYKFWDNNIIMLILFDRKEQGKKPKIYIFCCQCEKEVWNYDQINNLTENAKKWNDKLIWNLSK